jgi:chromate reductase
MRLLAVSGSLRRDSHNSRLLRAAAQQLPPGVELELYEGLKQIPPFDEDDEAAPAPEVLEWRTAIEAADAVLFATPEYNSSIPGQLKNAVDWASRPPEQPFDGKPIGLMGASGGTLGTARAQYHLRQAFVFLNGMVMNRPEVMVPQAHNKFDADGKLTDQATRDFLAAHLAAFKAWALRMR